MPVESLRNYLVGNLRPALFMMFAAVLAVLLIATVNIANLLLARGSVREREMAVRLSLGAARRRLVQQLLTESVLLSFAGAAAGLLLAFAGVRLFRAFNPAGVPLVNQVQLDWSVLLFTFTISVPYGVLFGLVPALQSARKDLQSALQKGGRTGSASSGHHRTRAVLVSGGDCSFIDVTDSGRASVTQLPASPKSGCGIQRSSRKPAHHAGHSQVSAKRY